MTASLFCDSDYLIELRRRTRPKPRCRDNRYPGYRQIRACPTRSTSVGPLSSSFCAELRAVRLLCCEKAELHLESKSEVIEHTQPGREYLVSSKVGQLYERLISGMLLATSIYISSPNHPDQIASSTYFAHRKQTISPLYSLRNLQDRN